MVSETDHIERLFKENYRVLFLYAKKFVKEHEAAYDIVQDVFTKLWQNRNQVAPEKARAYLFTSVRHACLNFIEHHKIVLTHQQEMQSWIQHEEILYYESAEVSLIEKEEHDKLWSFIEDLPPAYREVIKLRMKNFKTKEIADIQNIPVRTVETNIYRGMKILRERMVSMGCISYVMMLPDVVNCLNQDL